ncbi:MAG: hypothetical protein M1335_01290, partial [Chloroflexi bacterium]|nr:hypothetical protein [Chloroflexota bacterium]
PLKKGYELRRSGRMRFRDSSASNDDIRRLLDNYRPDAVAIDVLYGGERFRKNVLYHRSIMPDLLELVPESPLHLSLVIKLINTLERGVPVPDIFLFFDTAFFVDLPIQERTYALDAGFLGKSDPSSVPVRRFGYHGLYHSAAYRRVSSQYEDCRRVVSICLEPVPEVVGIYAGKPVAVSGGSTPMEGIPGNTTCGEIDPGILLFIEEKKKLGPESLNEMLARRSGLTALAGKSVSIDDVLVHGESYEAAKRLFEYRLLTACGSAIATMNGFDALAFSGRYVGSASILAGDLIPGLLAASRVETQPAVFFLRDTLDEIIAASYYRYGARESDFEEGVMPVGEADVGL